VGLVGKLPFQVIEEHQFGDLPAGIHDIPFFCAGQYPYMDLQDCFDPGKGLDPFHQFIPVFC